MRPKTRRWLRLAMIVLGIGLAAACGERGAKPKSAADMSAQQKARMAQSYLNAGRISDSLAVLEEAIAMEPTNAALFHFRGQVYFRTGDFAQAEKAFLHALELDPYHTDSHNFLGAVYTELGRPLDAEREYKIALADPAYPSPELVHLNLALLCSGQGREEEALTNLRRSVEINPKYYQAHFELASLLDRQGRLSEAAREYEVARPGYGESGDFHYRLGLAYFRLGEKQKARENLLRVLDVAPGSESAALAGDLLEVIQ